MRSAPECINYKTESKNNIVLFFINFDFENAIFMSKLLPLLFLFLFIHPTADAQEVRTDSLSEKKKFIYPKTPFRNKIYLYSAGLRVLKIDQFPKIMKQVDASDFRPVYLNALMFKFNDNQISYRLTGGFYKDDLTFNNECDDCEIVNGKLTDFSFKVGFEKMINYSYVQPYVGFDLGFRQNSFKGYGQNASTVNYTTPYDLTAEKNSLILAPLFGIKFNIIDHLSIAAESTIYLQYNYEREEKTYQDAGRNRTFQNDRNWEFLLRPLSLTLLYNFGQID